MMKQNTILENNRYKIIKVYICVNVFMEFSILHFLHNKIDIKINIKHTKILIEIIY